MRFLSADYIFPITSDPIKDGLVVVNDNGTILDVGLVKNISPSDNSKIEYHKGIICPGFINTHCHLELSRLRGKLDEGTGISSFIKNIISARKNFLEEEILQAIIDAEKEMINNGIVAVGDISNDKSTFKQKSKRNLLYHTFIEAFDLNPERADETFSKARKLEDELSTFNLPIRQAGRLSTSITPHAPYTVSEKLLELIFEHATKNKSIISIHNQESEEEGELFISGSGEIIDTFKTMGVDTNLLRKTGINSLRSTLPLLPKNSNILLVHNTYTSKDDIEWAQDLHQNLFWCTCPNANIYIENKLPNYSYFIDKGARVTIGTDSLASNWGLSILDELKTIAKSFPETPIQTLLLWATKNGADFFGFNQLGSIEKGKQPGLNLLENIEGLKISEKTEVMKLI